MKTTVVHFRKAKYDIYIGRGSDWGNPFMVGPYTREDAIEEYRKWILTQPQLLAKLPELKGKILGCWCKPKACHGDVLAEMADSNTDWTLLQFPVDHPVEGDLGTVPLC